LGYKRVKLAEIYLLAPVVLIHAIIDKISKSIPKNDHQQEPDSQDPDSNRLQSCRTDDTTSLPLIKVFKPLVKHISHLTPVINIGSGAGKEQKGIDRF
jgi:hypothetical protein